MQVYQKLIEDCNIREDMKNTIYTIDQKKNYTEKVEDIHFYQVHIEHLQKSDHLFGHREKYSTNAK